jgi:hypothetical protein
MENITISAYLTSEYNRLAYTHSYIFGYALKGMVYAARVMDARDILPYIATLDRASSKNGGTYALKYKPNMDKIAIIMAHACEIRPICSVDYMEQTFANSKLNRGQIFENMVIDSWHGVTVGGKNAKFTDCGDMVVDGVHYQVKFNKATFTDEKTLHNLAKQGER